MISFNRNEFYPLKKRFLISEVQLLLKKNILNSNIIKDFEIIDISSPTKIHKDSIIFIDKKLGNIDFKNDRIFVISNNIDFSNENQNFLLVDNLSQAYNSFINKMFYHDDIQNYPDDFTYKNGSYISNYSKIHDSVNIGKNCVISRGVKIGKNTIIKRIEKRKIIEKRSDDKLNTILKRYDKYMETTKPVLDYYSENPNFYEIDGSEKIDQITNKIDSFIKL